ncbi:MAG: hypothetical protein DMD82_06690 [Candidatus Rokuibacteriota bacterium]|nr:MAG: hypothetical protein DMD82_06690 [Candidatus Rokubacteria bacterium]
MELIPCNAALEAVSVREAGGKGWNLFRLRAFDFPVPDWYVLSSRVFDCGLEPHRAEIDALLAGPVPASREALEAAAARVAQWLEAWPLPPTLAADLAAAAERLAQGGTLSVRSSVVGEDSVSHSFAGLMESFLNVPPREVEAAIRKVWRSAFSARALAYRQRTGLAVAEISAAVIVQRLVSASASGVLFTREPGSGARRCVIAAALGLGEGVVADRAEADSFTVAWDSEEVESALVTKLSRVAPIAGSGGVTLETVPDSERDRPALTNRQILELRDAGVRAEGCFGGPQDMEWAFDGEGRLAILQARPIVKPAKATTPETGAEPATDAAPTTRAAPATDPSAGELRVWDNSNIVESYPGLTLPLTFSFVRSAYEHTFRNAALGFLIDKRAITPATGIFPEMIGLIEGRVYYNLLNWYAMLSYLPGFERHRQAWDEMIGITHRVEFPRRPLSPLNRAGAAAIAAWRLLSNARTGRVFFRHFDALWADFRSRDFSGDDEARLIAQYEELATRTRRVWYLTLYNDFAAMTGYEWLRRLCVHTRLAGEPNLHNDLLCGETGVESVAPLRSLLRLAERVRGDRRASALFERADDRGVWDAIHADPALADLSAALDRHVQVFGDRGLEELKLETASLREHPEVAIRLIRGYARGALSVEEMERREREVRRRAEAFAGRRLGGPLRRLAYHWVLRNTRLAIANRENMRFARTRLFGIVKRLFRRMAERFVARGLIERVDDLHYLTVEEVFEAATGPGARDLRALVAARRAEYAVFARHSPPERIITGGASRPAVDPAPAPARGEAATRMLRGIGCSSGKAEARARVVTDPSQPIPGGDHILVARSTDPGWLFLMVSSKGIVVEKGSVLSHTAIIGRELGIPTIVGVKEATVRIADGDRIAIDGSTGEIRWA